MTDVTKSDSTDKPKNFSESMALATTDEEKIKVYYQFGKGSIQDYARVFRFRVEDVLSILGLDDMSEVQTQGDLIDQSDMIGSTAQLNVIGTPAKAHYTTD